MCLDPSPMVTVLSNQISYHQTSATQRTRKKRKWNSLEREQEAARKVEEDKLMSMMDEVTYMMTAHDWRHHPCCQKGAPSLTNSFRSLICNPFRKHWWTFSQTLAGLHFSRSGAKRRRWRKHKLYQYWIPKSPRRSVRRCRFCPMDGKLCGRFASNGRTRSVDVSCTSICCSFYCRRREISAFCKDT